MEWVSYSGDTYKNETGTYSSLPRAAYILDGAADYENGRIALIPHVTRDALTSGSTYSPTVPYYAGPGIAVEGTTLYIRLTSTPQLDTYQQDVMPVFTSGTHPDSYKIAVILNHDYTVRVSASGVTLRYLQVEPARASVDIAADNVTIDRLTSWSPSEGYGIANSENASGVVIRDSRIYHDIGYWVAWVDCKAGPEVCRNMRPAGIRIMNTASSWTIERNHIRGFHDGIALNSDMGLPQFDGHYLRGGYDVQHGEQESGEKITKAVLRRVQRGRSAACAG